MSFRPPRNPAYDGRFSQEAFEPLHRGDATIEIPLEQVIGQYSTSSTPPQQISTGTAPAEKTGLYHRSGVRRSLKSGMKRGGTGRAGYDGEEDRINRMGLFYERVLSSSLVIRYLVYILPLGILLAIPMIIGATIGQEATLGDVRIVWLFMWMLVAWVGLWVSKLVAHYLPQIFLFLCGIVSSEVRKYALVLKALEIPLSLVGWALISLSTFIPIMTRNPDTRRTNRELAAAGKSTTSPHWETVIQRILAAALVSSLIFLGERLFIQIISINYHRKQFAARIRESKEHVRQLTLLYDASRAMFPAFCAEFAEEDAIISDTIDVTLARKTKRNHQRSGSGTPLRLLRDAGRFGDKVTAAFGHVAHEITGKNVFNPDSARSVVSEALERSRSAEALARRLWLSFVIEGNEALYLDDIVEVLGSDHQAEAEECFAVLDSDGNGDVSLDEMIMTIAEFGREERSMASGMHDVDQAINVLDRMLCVVIFVAIIFVFIAFLNTSFVTTLATAGTALLSLSFVFSVTCQEVLGSCIFLFVKHPFDIGDRVDLTSGNDQLVVEHISLLFTVFRRVSNHRTVQIPNIVLNTLWIENVTRSKAMREQITVDIQFDTTLEDVQLLRNELGKFVADKDNSRDFQPDVQVEVLGVGNLDKLQLQIEVLHKSNWGNETLRAARRSKFLCALVLALRRVPIYGPGGGNPALGEAGNPAYSVAIPDSDAAKARAQAATDKEAKRMIPTRQPPPQSPDDDNTTRLAKQSTPLSPIFETHALDTLNERNPALDSARDGDTHRDDGVTGRDRRGSETGDLEQTRGILRRATTKGRRKSGKTSEPATPVVSRVEVPAAAAAHGALPPRIAAPSPLSNQDRSWDYAAAAGTGGAGLAGGPSRSSETVDDEVRQGRARQPAQQQQQQGYSQAPGYALARESSVEGYPGGSEEEEEEGRGAFGAGQWRTGGYGDGM